MPVVVVQTDTDEPDPGVHGGEEGGVGVGRAVMRHLQHVGPDVDPRREHRLLRLDLHIARQQQA